MAVSQETITALRRYLRTLKQQWDKLGEEDTDLIARHNVIVALRTDLKAEYDAIRADIPEVIEVPQEPEP